MPTFNDFSSLAGLTLNGTTAQALNAQAAPILRLTTETLQASSAFAGSAFYDTPIALDATTSFNTHFQFQLAGGYGGDGFTFVLQNSAAGTKALGGTGGSLGYSPDYNPSTVSIGRSLAIEFDTYQNPSDPDGNRISVVRDGDLTRFLASANPTFNLRSGEVLDAWVDYDAATEMLKVYADKGTDKPAIALISDRVNLGSVLGNQAYVGFTAGTGSLADNQDIKNWSFATSTASSTAKVSDPAIVAFGQPLYSVAENGGSANVTITRTSNLTSAFTIGYTTSDVTAKAGIDYTATTGILNFAADETSKTIAIPIIDNAIADANKTLNLILNNPGTGAAIGVQSTSILTIVDNDAPLPLTPVIQYETFSRPQGIVFNGNAGLGGKEFNTLRLVSGAEQAGSVFYADPLAITPNTSFQTHFEFQLSGGSGADGADGFTFLLQNNDGGSQTVGNPGGSLGYDDLQRNDGRQILNSLAIEFDTYQNDWDADANHIAILQNGDVTTLLATATPTLNLNSGAPLDAWIDYDNATSLLKIFLSDSPTKPATPLLSYEINLLTAVGQQAYVGFTGGSGGLFNNEDILSWNLSSTSPLISTSPGNLSFEQPIYRANENSQAATINVIRMGGTAGAISVNYATSDGTAIAGNNYTPTQGVLTFADGETSKTIQVPVIDNGVPQPTETVNLTLSNPTGGSGLGTQRTSVLRILDNDGFAGAFVFSQPNYVVNGNTATITVTRADGTTGAVSVDYTTSNDTATAESDYTATAGTLTFADGETTKTIAIPILNTATTHPSETVNLSLSNPRGGTTLGAQNQAVLTILESNNLELTHDVVTQRNNNSRTASYLTETLLNTRDVNQNTFGKLFTRTVDGQIYAQPLYLSNVNLPGKGVHNVVFVATMHNTMYAFDADDPNADAPLWSVNLGPSIKLPDPKIGPTGYKDIAIEVGIIGTPVIDKASNTLYVVTMTKEGNTYSHVLYALDLTTGVEKGAVTITGSVPGTGDGSRKGVVNFNNTTEVQRAGLLLSKGKVYIAFGAFGDNPPYHGWIFSYDATTLQQQGIYNASPDGEGAGIWQSGNGLTADADGNIYFSTGNGDLSPDDPNGGALSDSVVKLSPDLKLLDWFAPYNSDELSAIDADLGSAGELLIPGTNLLLGGGKEGKLYLLDKNNLGHFNPGADTQIVQSWQATGVPVNGADAPVGAHTIHDSPVYWNGPNGPEVYIWGENDWLKAYRFDPNTNTFDTNPIVTSAAPSSFGFPGSILSLSADGGKAGTGIIWATSPFDRDANHFTVTGVIRAFDATTMQEIWNSKQNADRDDVGNFAKFNPLTIANGKVYAPTFSNNLAVYGLLT
jgi:hypothetical protein